MMLQRRRLLIGVRITAGLFLLLLGASISTPVLAQTPAWEEVAPTDSGPGGRMFHSAVYDAASERMIVFGGLTAAGSASNQVWVLTNANNLSGTPVWTNVTPGSGNPSARSMHGAVYDSVNKTMVIFGGRNAAGACLNDAWILKNADTNSPAWEQLSPDGTAPGIRSNFLSAYSATANKLVVAGGGNCTTFPYQDLYTLSRANNVGGTPAWTALSPTGTVETGALGEVSGTSIYDGVNDRLMFWGSTYLPAKYTILSNASGTSGTPAWNVMTLPTSPTTAALGQTAIYNSSNNKAVFFGGGIGGGASNDTWGVANANGLTGTPTWANIDIDEEVEDVPAARFGHTAVFDSANDRMIVYGGTTGDGAFTDVWVLADATQFDWDIPAPSLTSISPTSGGVGTNFNVTLSGADFVTGATSVTVAGTGVTVSNVTVTAASTLTANFAITPSAAAGTRGVFVTTSAGSSNTVNFTVTVTGTPTLTGLSPNHGAPDTETTIVLTGTNFVAGLTTVAVSGTGVTVTGVNVTNPTSLTATIAVEDGTPSGNRNLTVTTPQGTTNTRVYSIITAVPGLATISPASGNARVPITVSFAGTNFIAGHTSVVFAGSGDVTISNINVVTTGTVTATVTIDPTAEIGARDVTITTPNGTSNVRVFTITSAVPALTSITPSSGNALAPVTVSIRGTNFMPGAGQTVVTVGGTGVTVDNISVLSSSTLTATFTMEPDAQLGARGVTVSTAAGTSSPRTFTISNAGPTLSSLTPAYGSGTGSFTMRLTGTRFVPGETTIEFSGDGITVGTIAHTGQTTMSAPITIAPTAAPGLRTVTVTTPFGTSNSRTFTVRSAVPTLSSVSPGSGNAATPVNVTLTGTNFAADSAINPSGTGITVSNLTVVNATRLTATFTIAPSAATGARGITVSTAAGTSSSRSFNVSSAAPSLSAVSPSNGSALAPVNVTLTGTNFVDDEDTEINVSGTGITVSDVVVVNSTKITATFTIAQGAATGLRTVTVTTAYGGPSVARSFTVNSGAPTLSSISPNTGSALAPVTVTLTGTNFVDPVSVSAGAGVTVSNVILSSSTVVTATFTIAANATPGSRSVTVSTDFGTSGSRTFTVANVAPIISSITPNSSSVSSGSVQVVLTGTNFTSGYSLNIAGSGVTVATSAFSSSTAINATFNIASNAALGARGVTVSTAFGTSSSANFTVTAAAPTLALANPNSGFLGTSPTVTLTGTGFIAGQTLAQISGSGVSISSVNVASSTSITLGLTVSSTAATGSRNITVSTLLGSSNSVTFTVSAPTLSSISPNSGEIDSDVDIVLTGTGFVSGVTTYVLGGTGITVSSYAVTSGTQAVATFHIAADAPLGSRTVKVKTGNTESNSVTFTVYGWNALDSLSTPHFVPAAGAIGGLLYVASGVDDVGTSARTGAVEAYNPTTNSWTTKLSIPNPRYASGYGVISDKLYVAGGQLDSPFNNSAAVHVYDPGSNTWTEVESLPDAGAAMASAVLDGKLYVIGGKDSTNANTIDDVRVYDPVNDSWDTDTAMTTAREFAGAAVVDGKLYVIGGRDGTPSAAVEKFDPVTHTWSAKASMPTARYLLSVVASGGLIYAIGGHDGSNYVDTVEVYDPADDTWEELTTSMPAARAGMGVDVIDGKIYAAGGRSNAAAVTTLESFVPQP
jgi:N-acetylneuraminic acid mutarotase